MKCWISAFNAQGSRGTIVPVQVGAGGAAQEKRKTGRNSGTIKVDGSWVSTPLWMLMYFSAGFSKIHQTQGTGAVFSWLYGCLYFLR
jgi:hypothetical protein